MKRVSGKRMCRVLERRGWVLDRVKGSHHIYREPNHPFPVSVPVHGNKTLKPGTQRAIMRAAGLTDDDL
jgi:predicted RNA binding protein YcfA (HicA-like mRNA interferase family)